MKKIILLAFSALWIALPVELKAQDDKSPTQEVKKGVKKGARGVKKGVKKGAHEVAEQASELKSDVTDKEVEHKTGPKGDEDIFMDNNGRYYYKDGKGHRVYLKESELRDRAPKKDDD